MPETKSTESWLPPEFRPGLVSVVIPTFNRAQLVCETVRSVFAQTCRPLEIIVGDDASTDDTLERLRDLESESPDGVTLQSFGGEKVGACPRRNRGAALSHGEYLMFLDSDDLLTAPALEQLRQSLQNSAADLSWGPWRDLYPEPDACRLNAPVSRTFSEDWLSDLIRGEWLATCAVLYRREVLNRIQGWHEPVVLDGDFDFNVQLGATGASLSGSKGVVSYYRRGGADQISEQNFLHKTEHTHEVLRRAEAALDSRNAWTPARRSAVAARYFESARMVWYYTGAAEKFEELASEAKRIDPSFKPTKFWYRWIASVAGMRNAERVAAVGRKLFR